jgi:hypothetical protein
MNKYLWRGIFAFVICGLGCLAGAQTPPPNKAQPSTTPAPVDCSKKLCVATQDQVAAINLPPVTGVPLDTLPETVDCSKKGCALSREQLSAITSATQMYRADMPKVQKFHLDIVSRESTIEVTLAPDYVGDIPPYSVPGDKMAVTYIFDSSGAVLKKKYFNR